MRFLISIIFFLSFASTATAENTVYFGMGQGKTATGSQNGENPWSLGFISNGTGFGFDIAGEGTVLDSTYNQNRAPNRAMSYNLIVARGLSEGGLIDIDAGLLVGFREATKDCADSFLGYACYADAKPDIDYEFNYGAVLLLGFDTFVVGARVTSESSQLTLGLKF